MPVRSACRDNRAHRRTRHRSKRVAKRYSRPVAIFSAQPRVGLLSARSTMLIRAAPCLFPPTPLPSRPCRARCGIARTRSRCVELILKTGRSLLHLSCIIDSIVSYTGRTPVKLRATEFERRAAPSSASSFLRAASSEAARRQVLPRIGALEIGAVLLRSKIPPGSRPLLTSFQSTGPQRVHPAARAATSARQSRRRSVVPQINRRRFSDGCFSTCCSSVAP